MRFGEIGKEMRKFFIFLGTCGLVSIALIFVTLVNGVSPRSQSVVKSIPVDMK